MKTLTKLSALFLLLVSFAGISHAQATLSQTTLSGAVTSTSYGNQPGTSIVLASVTNIVAPNLTSNTAGTILYVDKEAMQVQTVNTSTKTVTVVRGYDGTASRSHSNGAIVWYGPPNYFSEKDLSGSCTLTSNLVNPTITTVSGLINYCYDGQWTSQPSALTVWQNATGRFRYSTVPIGSVAYASVGNQTTMVAGTQYCADVTIPRAITATGIGVLIGTTGTTDNWLVILYDAAGNLVANSATAGALVGTASTIEQFAFSPGTVPLLGPGDYYACVQSNGTHATLATVAASTFIDVLTKSATGVFGTVPSTFVVPTTFTANVGPIAYVY